MLAIILHQTPDTIREMSIADAEAVVKMHNRIIEAQSK